MPNHIINVMAPFKFSDRLAMNRLHIQKPLTRTSDIIWQHMRVEYFELLLKHSQLCFKPISSYNNELERNPVTCVFNIEEMFSKDAFGTREAFSTLNTHSYLSCWYRSPYVVDGIFKRFTTDSNGEPDLRGGVAIRTKVSKLRKSLSQAISLTNPAHFYFGLVRYLSFKEIKNYVIPSFKRFLYKSKTIEPIVPYFFKRTSLGDENEFRAFLQLGDLDDANIHNKTIARIANPANKFIEISLIDTIEGFAIPYAYYPLEAMNSSILEKLDACGLKAIEEDDHMDGYVYYRIERA